MIINNNTLPSTRRTHPLLRGLQPEYLQEMLVQSTIEEYDDDSPMIAVEGERADKLYLILEGQVEVLKQELDSQQQFHIRICEPGDFLGEFALFSQQLRTASLKALGPTKLLAFSRETLLNSRTRPWFGEFALNLAKELSEKLDYTSNITAKVLKKLLEEIKLREQINRFLLYVLSSLSVYTIVVAFVSRNSISQEYVRIIANLMALIIFGFLVQFLRRNKNFLHLFGIRMPTDWKNDLSEALLVTSGLIIALIQIKLLLIQTVPSLAQFPLFHHPLTDLPYDLFMIAVYLLVVPIQELVARGALQSSFNMFFYDETTLRRQIYAILLSNALFAVLHAYLSASFAIITFLPGLVWGVLYARQDSLFGVTVSHMIFGVWGIHILRIPIMLGTLGL